MVAGAGTEASVVAGRGTVDSTEVSITASTVATDMDLEMALMPLILQTVGTSVMASVIETMSEM